MSWPREGGWLARWGLPPEEIEGRSRDRAQALAARRWDGLQRDLAAAVLYASGDASLVDSISLLGEPPAQPTRVLVDVSMVRSGLRAGLDCLVAVEATGADALARRSSSTRSAAGLALLWEVQGQGGLVAIGNSPTALLACLDLAAAGPPSFVIATCPGFTLAEQAKRALVESGLPHLAVLGTRGGSPLAAAAINALWGRG